MNVLWRPATTSLRGHRAAPRPYAVKRADGVYEGFLIPGPGAVLVETSHLRDYRPAYVDPKGFFGFGKIDWADPLSVHAYGNRDTLELGYGYADQQDYAAIVLVNPPVDSKPLELSATIVRNQTRTATLLDPEGQPVVGAKPEGFTDLPGDYEPQLRAATFPLWRMHPDRSRRITFVKEDRKLIGFLFARGQAETTYTVRMQPWATLTGRIVDSNGHPFSVSGPKGKQESPAWLQMNPEWNLNGRDDPTMGAFPGIQTDANGRFHMERLNPHQRYTAEIHREGQFSGSAFKDLTLQPGENRDLGDLRIQPPSTPAVGAGSPR